MMKFAKYISLVILGLALAIFIIIAVPLALINLNNSKDTLKSYYLDNKEITLQNIEIQNYKSDLGTVLSLESIYRGNLFKASVRKSQNPKYIVVLFAGSRTGKDSLNYIKGLLEDYSIIAMDYPFENKKYGFFEFVYNLPKWRRGLLDLALVAREFTNIIMKDMNTRVPIVSAGVSFGAPFAYQLVAIDHQIKAIIFCYGFSDIGKMTKHTVQQYFKRKGLRDYFFPGLAEKLLELLVYPLEPLHWIGQNKEKKILFFRGDDDKNVPDACINPFIKAHKTYNEIVITGEHFDKGTEGLIEQISENVNTWLLKY